MPHISFKIKTESLSTFGTNGLDQRERKRKKALIHESQSYRKKAYGLYLVTPIPSKSIQSVIVCDCLRNFLFFIC